MRSGNRGIPGSFLSSFKGKHENVRFFFTKLGDILDLTGTSDFFRASVRFYEFLELHLMIEGLLDLPMTEGHGRHWHT